MTDDQTFTRDDVQTWIDSLDDRESAMLAHAVDTHCYQATLETLTIAAEAVADQARTHAKHNRIQASKATREVVDVLMRVRRDAERAAAVHAAQQPEVMQ